MKYIQKSPEPKELKQWRATQLAQGVNFTYQNFQNPEKAITRQSLLQEQGWICCYCCQRISLGISHLEHFDPQSKTHPVLRGYLETYRESPLTPLIKGGTASSSPLLRGIEGDSARAYGT